MVTSMVSDGAGLPYTSAGPSGTMSMESNDRRTHSYPHHDLVSGRLRLVTTAPYDYVFPYTSKPSRVEISRDPPCLFFWLMVWLTG
jgi:hypothetical protein